MSLKDIDAALGLNTDELTVNQQAEMGYLWGIHLRLQAQGKDVYYVSMALCQLNGLASLEALATKMSHSAFCDVYVHVSGIHSLYRIGQIADQDDKVETASMLQLYHIQTLSNEKIPKPRNSWILYRQSRHARIQKKYPGMHTSEISVILGNLWRNESDAVREIYEKQAEEERANHAKMYPGWKCQPRKSSQIKRRIKRDENQVRCDRLIKRILINTSKSRVKKDNVANAANRPMIEHISANASGQAL